MDHCGFNIDPTLQSDLLILPKLAPGSLDDILSLEFIVESKLVVVSACYLFI